MDRSPRDRAATAPPAADPLAGTPPSSPPAAPAAPAAPADAPVPPLGPTTGGEREPILDVLRGFALLGILLVNMELMRGPVLYRGLAGELEAPAGLDQALQFLVGWLAAGKFVSSFAIMFGIGAALIAMKAVRAGRSPRRLLARRYAILLALGVAHMILLFPGDILFAYGLAGLLLLAFVRVRARTALRWGGGILAVLLVLGLGLGVVATMIPEPAADEPAGAAMGITPEFLSERAEHAVFARQEGSYGDVVVAHAWEVALIQAATLVFLPWITALFLIGFWAGRSGLVHDLRGHRRGLRAAMIAGLAIGLPLNLVAGYLGPLSMGVGGPETDPGGMLIVLATTVQVVGAPLLAVGYLSALALLCLRTGPIAPLAAVGRMALTGYVLQSLLALVLLAGFGLYDRITTAQALLATLGIWAILLIVCPLWLRHFRFGPVEWLWRSLTYGQRQPLRAG